MALHQIWETESAKGTKNLQTQQDMHFPDNQCYPWLSDLKLEAPHTWPAIKCKEKVPKV